MTLKEMVEIFQAEDREFLKFERVENKRSSRADLHGFLLLEELHPGETHDMVSSAEHDEIWLGVDPEEIALRVTREQVIELKRCGVRWDSSFECFAMFV